MISTTPLRRMILQRSQRGLTDARTFMIFYTLMSMAAVQSATNSPRQPPMSGSGAPPQLSCLSASGV